MNAPATPDGWRTLAATVRGPSHERSGTPNQDAVGVLQADGSATIAVADGHGGRRYFRSHRGSRLAVDIALDVLRSQRPSGAQGADAEQVLREATGSIVERWTTAVLDDLRAEPPSDEEISTAGADADAIRADPLRAYGATLAAAVVIPGGIGLLQIGDGDLVVVDADGSSTRPLPDDPRLIADETTSLCLPDAVEEFRVRWLPAEPQTAALVLACTDGYGNSFAEHGETSWHEQVGSDLIGLLDQHGHAWVEERLEDWLGASAHHSGDDTSVAIAHRIATHHGEEHGGDVSDEPALEEGTGEPQRPGGVPGAPSRRRRATTLGVVLFAGIALGLLLGWGVERVTGVTDEVAEGGAPTTIVSGGLRWTVENERIVVRDPETDEVLDVIEPGFPLGRFGTGDATIWVPSAGGERVVRIATEDRSWSCLPDGDAQCPTGDGDVDTETADD